MNIILLYFSFEINYISVSYFGVVHVHYVGLPQIGIVLHDIPHNFSEGMCF